MSDFVLNIIDDDDEVAAKKNNHSPWLIGIIDDEPSVHDATRLAMNKVELLERPISFVSAFSGEEGFELIRKHPDMAVVLLDVVMETDDAGLKLVERIRDELNNPHLQIILRTGQPGYAPEEEIITKYEINSYKTKSELTRARLFTAIATALRSYRQIMALETSRQGLRSVIDASADLIRERSVFEFASGVLKQIDALFNISAESLFCVSQRPHAGPSALRNGLSDNYVVVAASEKYHALFGKDIKTLDSTDDAISIVHQVLENKEHHYGERFSCLYLSTPSGWEGVIVAENATKLKGADQELLQVFCMNVALGLENAKFFTHLNRAAYIDSVTDLYSRTGLIEHAKHFVQKHNDAACLYLLDIDYFHHIIESLGYEYGDKILCKIAKTLRKLYGEETLIARLHSDVFALMLPTAEASATDVAVRCSRPLYIDNNSIRVGLTVGAALYSNKLTPRFDPETLLRQAEMALKVAKENRRGTGETFNLQYEQASRDSMSLMSDLRSALEHKELFLVLQPKVSASTREVIGYEALIRWKHPQKGLIPPGAFIPAVEKSGLYYEVDLYVAQAAIDLLKAHPEIDVPISINISANSLHHDSYVEDLYSLFRDQDICMSCIELEVTENALVRSDAAIRELDKLRDLGFVLCLDDFGAGYSSLGYLLRLPVSTIKIDRTFVLDLAQSKDAQAVLHSIVDIGDKLKKHMVVEGVETLEQLEMVTSMGVDIIQGFYFYKPLPVDEAIKLRQHK